MVVRNLTRLLGDGVYVGVCTGSRGLKLIKEETQNTPAQVIVNYEFGGVTLDEIEDWDKVPFLHKVFSGHLRMGFSTIVKTAKQFYELLDKRAWKSYPRMHLGYFSKPKRLELDEESIKIKIGESFGVGFKDKTYNFTEFNIKFKAQGDALYQSFEKR